MGETIYGLKGLIDVRANASDVGKRVPLGWAHSAKPGQPLFVDLDRTGLLQMFQQRY